MAFTGSTIWECESGGDDTNNGGGFDFGVAGFPTDGAATVANTGSPVFTSASYNFVAGDVGAWIFIKSGTNWTPGLYKIVSVAANAATLSAAVGAAVLFYPWSTATSGLTSAPGGLNTAAGCATTASPSGATWGIDYSQQTAARFTSATFAIDATTNTKLTDGTNTIGKNWVGNIISITSGTGFTVQRVAIVSTSGTAATVDKSLGTLGSTGGNGKLGGAVATPGILGSLVFPVSLNVGFILYATYSLTVNTSNVAGGPPAGASAASNGNALIGYSAGLRFFGNTGTQPVLQNNASTISTIGGGGGFVFNGWFVNLMLDGNSQTAARPCSNNTASFLYCTIKNYNTAAANGNYVACVLTGNSVTILPSNLNAYCEAYGNTATAFPTPAYFCLAYSNTGASTDGFTGASAAVAFIHCISVSNGRDGFTFFGNTAVVLNCHAEANTGTGFKTTAKGVVLIGCTHYNNTGGGASAGLMTGVSLLTASPFVNAAGGNFALNNLASAGAAMRAAAYAGYVKNLFPRGLTAHLGDIGAAQSRVPWQTLGLDGGLNG